LAALTPNDPAYQPGFSKLWPYTSAVCSQE
jgi:hypothetical protein